MSLFAPPYAAVLCSLNGGTATAGPQVVTTTGTTIQLSAVNPTGWVTGLWQLYDYPPGFSTPSGWQLDSVGGSIYYSASQSAPNPPVFTQQAWGKIGVALTVNLGIDPTGIPNAARLIDLSCSTTMVSPSAGLFDMIAGEASVFGGFRLWVGDHKTNLRTLEAYIASGGLTPPAAVISTNTTLPAPTVNTTYPIDTTSGPVTVTFTGTPTAGVVATFVDVTKMWATHAFEFAPSSGELVRNPGNLSAADASAVFLTLAGATASFKYFPLVGTGGTWI